MNRQPSSAENLFNELRGLPPQQQFARLAKLVGEKEQESEWLEFKGAGRVAKVGDINTDDDKWLKAEWSKYLSAFANSGGGLIVWGIGTGKDDATRREFADKFNHVREPEKFKARLDDLTNKATYPPVAGVVNLAIKEPDKDIGCVVSYIPNSESKPHRAEYGYLNRVSTSYESACYYTRVGDDCGVMAHELLRHCFHPRSAPILDVSLTVKWKQNWILLLPIISNRGQLTAESPHIRLSLKGSLVFENFNNYDRWHRRDIIPKREWLLGFNDGFIHAGLDLAGPELMVGPGPQHPLGAVLVFNLYAKNVVPRRVQVTVAEKDLVDGAIVAGVELPVG